MEKMNSAMVCRMTFAGGLAVLCSQSANATGRQTFKDSNREGCLFVCSFSLATCRGVARNGNFWALSSDFYVVFHFTGWLSGCLLHGSCHNCSSPLSSFLLAHVLLSSRAWNVTTLPGTIHLVPSAHISWQIWGREYSTRVTLKLREHLS